MQRPASMPVDRGWAWVVALASAGIFGMVGGSLKSAGILYVEATEHFSNAGVGSLWIFTVSQAATMIIGPAAAACIRRTSHRTVIIVGTLVMTASIIASGYLPEVNIMFLTWTLQGFGAGCLYIGGLTCTVPYFDHHKGLAVGLAGAGSGLGSFALPNCLRLLFDHYTYEGAMLLYGGIVLHVAIAAILVRPASYYDIRCKSARPQPPQQQQRSAKGDTGNMGNERPPAISNSGEPGGGDGTDMQEMQILRKETDGHGTDSTAASSASPAPPATTIAPAAGGSLLAHAKRLCALPRFWLIAGMSFFSACALSVVYAAVPPLGRQMGVEKATIAMLIAIGGAMETFARAAHGWFSDRRYITSLAHVSICLGITALGSFACLLLGSGTVGIGVLEVTLGLFGTAVMSLTPVVVRDLLGAANVELGMGAVMAFQATSVLISTAATNVVVSTTGSWKYVFYYVGSSFGLASIISGSFALKRWIQARMQK